MDPFEIVRAQEAAELQGRARPDEQPDARGHRPWSGPSSRRQPREHAPADEGEQRVPNFDGGARPLTAPAPVDFSDQLRSDRYGIDPRQLPTHLRSSSHAHRNCTATIGRLPAMLPASMIEQADIRRGRGHDAAKQAAHAASQTATALEQERPQAFDAD